MTSHRLPPTNSDQPIIALQTPQTRALNVGFIQKNANGEQFIPGRLHLGALRELDTAAATIQSLQLPETQNILAAYKPPLISTVTLMRETLSCHLNSALWQAGIRNHYGDAFIGASHIKGDGDIRTAYLYENIEGLYDGGLWLIADSICMGRNLLATLDSLLTKSHPQEILFICPIASRIGINSLGTVLAKHQVPTTFLAWGGLFGVDETTKYDMPWGHPDTEPVDIRDQKLMMDIYGSKICMGGDFGNNYYCPSLALDLYHQQLHTHGVTPRLPAAAEIRKIYSNSEILTRE